MADNLSGPVLGEVVYVEEPNALTNDNADACRVKVKLDSDKSTPIQELPYAFPLNPKLFHVMPKIGEGVFVFTSKINDFTSQRYYIGPILSQPQFYELCEYRSGRGDAVSLIDTAKPLVSKPLTSISRKKDLTEGAYPTNDDVALIGRGQEDIILKYKSGDEKYGYDSEVDLRAGVRLKPSDSTVKYLKGNVVFNNVSPGFIQVRHNTNGISGKNSGVGDSNPFKYESPEIRQARSVVNVVADKINLISHKDATQFGENIADRKELVKTDEMDNIMSQLHRAVYGDELVRLLQLIVRALKEHTHPFPMKPPTIYGTTLEQIKNSDFESILSPNVRIS